MLSALETPAIECEALTKRYPGGFVALRELSLRIPRGAAFGLLGENGAGKSTLVRLVMGFNFPSAGALRVLGERDPARAHPRVGYVHERPIFEPRFSGREHLAQLAMLAGLRGETRRHRVAALLDLVQLAHTADRRCGTYSKGMLQRLAIAQALLGDPELLVLDEPTAGLDPLAQYEIRRLIAALHEQGKTILLCSHYLAEVEAICDRVGILRRGRLIQQGTVSDLLRPAGTVEIELGDGVAADEVAARLGLAPLVVGAEGARLRIRAADQPRVLAALVAAEVPLRSLHPLAETLEDLYVRVAGAAPDAAAGGDRLALGMGAGAGAGAGAKEGPR